MAWGGGTIPVEPHNFLIFKDHSRTWCFFKDLSRPKRTMIYLINPLNRSSSNELTHFLKWMKSEHVTFHLQYKHSGTFANLKNCLTPKIWKTCDPILVTLLKIRPRYSQSSRGNCDPNQRHIPISLNTPPPTPPHPVGFCDDLNLPLRVRSFDIIRIKISDPRSFGSW